MKGKVFTVSKLHYINGVVYFTAQKGTTDLQTLANNYPETTRSGKVKHPVERVRMLLRFAKGLCLLTRSKDKKVKITELGKEYFSARSESKWSISEKQRELLGNFILSDYYRTETIYSITTLFRLIKSGYKDRELANQYAIDIGKNKAWKSDVTYKGFTQYGLNYINELGLHDIDESDLLFKELSRDIKYQENVNRVDPITIPDGKLPRSKPRKYGKSERYQSNPRRSKNALIAAEFKCEFDVEHITFISNSTKQQYMEAHHLIPMREQGAFQYDIDVPENILCICPNCHRKIHLAEYSSKEKLLKRAYNLRRHQLDKREIVIGVEALMNMYKGNKKAV